jgi:hypothetical protein
MEKTNTDPPSPVCLAATSNGRNRTLTPTGTIHTLTFFVCVLSVLSVSTERRRLTLGRADDKFKLPKIVSILSLTRVYVPLSE